VSTDSAHLKHSRRSLSKEVQLFIRATVFAGQLFI